MSGAAHNAQHEFWRPPVSQKEANAPAAVECARCGTEFMAGAGFCHVCGAARQTRAEPAAVPRWTRHLVFQAIKRSVGLPTYSLVAFIVGVVCVLAAAAIGSVYSTQTLLDWQAVQILRAQWLLAAVAAFVAGILLKPSSN